MNTYKPNYHNEALAGLKELLGTDNIQQNIKQYHLDEMSYRELIGQIITEEPKRKFKTPRRRKGPGW